ncbi:probable NOT transcription complex subunit VIP2 isoform X2 [Abrus precatorius]|uniref:Probable NOT transcription complex subunit VIP2 isoform X2 n=1 Tax=Abrus precatorius TaxID=3816 RepID=A0A8B8KU72_ABRPR|nr:probable NOT transcription complex subunit VIP2 isoform X2 [Abrus precatorius]
MSGLLNSSLNGSASNLPDGAGRSFASSFSGAIQGLHNIHGSFNVPNMPGTLTSRNSTINSVPSGGVQQPTGSLSSGRFASNNIPVALSQLSHGSSHGHSGVTNRGGISVVGNPGFSSSTNGVGGSIPGILPTSAAVGNRNAVPGLGVSPILGNAGGRITSSVGNMVGGGNIGRTGGGLSVPGLASRLNLGANSGSAGLGMQGQNRLMSGVLPQGSPQVISMLGNSYPSAGGPLSQSHVQAVSNLNSMGMLNDVNSNDNSPFDLNDFPQLTSRPSSAGGPQGQLGSLRKQGLSPIVQQNQEFSIQNEDFPALPGFKGGNADYAMDMHQKEQLHDNAVPMMQSQHFSMGRSAGFSLGGTYSSHRAQQQQHAPSVSSGNVSFSSVNNQDLLHLHGSDIFPSSHSTYHSQTSGPPGIGLRPLNSPNTVSGMGSYDQLIQQYQQHQNQSQFRLQMSAVNQSFRDQGMKSIQTAQSTPDPFGLLGLLSVIRMSDPDLTSLALGIDLTTLGLNLNSSENLHKTFGSPWSEEPAKGDPEFNVPQCYYAKQPPALHQGYFSKFSVETLFYIFYSMPKDEAQLYAANELYNRGWFYHKEHRMWYIRVPNLEPLVKTNTYERGSYHSFDPNLFEIVHKDNIVLHYEMLEKRPHLPQH